MFYSGSCHAGNSKDRTHHESLWHYLGWRITQQTISPQSLRLYVKDTLTLNELQKLLGSLNWLCPGLGLSIELLHPLSDLLRRNPHLYAL